MNGLGVHRPVRHFVRAGVLCAVILAAWFPRVALANHLGEWVHDHSSSGIPSRPNGLSEMVARFGVHCSNAANDSRSYWPVQSSRTTPGYVYVNTYIGRDVAYNVRTHINAAHRDGAVDYGVYGYNCRYIAGTTTWSTHAFGAAVDTNSARNPVGQDRWNGRGADGTDYGTYLPDIWRGSDPGHRFFWGLNFSTTPDPMHFQYVTGY